MMMVPEIRQDFPRPEKLRQRLHIRRPYFHRRSSRAADVSSPNLSKLLKDEDFAGIRIINDKIKIDEDLLQTSERSLETLVTVGMQLGVSTKKHSDVLPSIEKLGIDD